MIFKSNPKILNLIPSISNLSLDKKKLFCTKIEGFKIVKIHEKIFQQKLLRITVYMK